MTPETRMLTSISTPLKKPRHSKRQPHGDTLDSVAKDITGLQTDKTHTEPVQGPYIDFKVQSKTNLTESIESQRPLFQTQKTGMAHITVPAPRLFAGMPSGRQAVARAKKQGLVPAPCIELISTAIKSVGLSKRVLAAQFESRAVKPAIIVGI